MIAGQEKRGGEVERRLRLRFETRAVPCPKLAWRSEHVAASSLDGGRYALEGCKINHTRHQHAPPQFPARPLPNNRPYLFNCNNLQLLRIRTAYRNPPEHRLPWRRRTPTREPLSPQRTEPELALTSSRINVNDPGLITLVNKLQDVFTTVGVRVPQASETAKGNVLIYLLLRSKTPSICLKSLSSDRSLAERVRCWRTL